MCRSVAESGTSEREVTHQSESYEFIPFPKVTYQILSVEYRAKSRTVFADNRQPALLLHQPDSPRLLKMIAASRRVIGVYRPRREIKKRHALNRIREGLRPSVLNIAVEKGNGALY